jgi:hypothetical protein
MAGTEIRDLTDLLLGRGGRFGGHSSGSCRGCGRRGSRCPVRSRRPLRRCLVVHKLRGFSSLWGCSLAAVGRRRVRGSGLCTACGSLASRP